MSERPGAAEGCGADAVVPGLRPKRPLARPCTVACSGPWAGFTLLPARVLRGAGKRG